MDYRIRVFIPSSNKFEYVDELKNRQSLAILKYIKANDDYGLCNYFENILKDTSAQNIEDKFFILCQLRALNIGNSLTVNGKDDTGAKTSIKISLFDFLKNYIEYVQKSKKQYIYQENNLQIVFKLPTTLYFKNFLSLLNDSIERILINNEDIIQGKNNIEKFEIISKFNKETMLKIKDFLNEINQASTLFFLKPTEQILVPTVKVSFFNNTVFNLLKTIFKTEFNYFYNKFYICLTKLGISYDDYLKLSFVEADILLNTYKAANQLK